MSDLLNLTVSQLRQAAELKEKIDALNSELSAIFGGKSVSAPASSSVTRPDKAKPNGKLTLGRAILEALRANGGVIGRPALLAATSKLKGAKVNAGSFDGQLLAMKKSGTIKSPGRGQFQIGTGGAGASAPAPATAPASAAEPKAKGKRTMSPAARAKIAAAARARWAKVRAMRPKK